MKKILVMIFAVCALLLCSCDSYKVTSCIQTNNKNEYSIRFGTFEGTKSTSIKNNLDGDGTIQYTASLEEGIMNVYYEVNGTEELLFTIEGNDNVSFKGGYITGKGGYITGNGKVKIIMKTTEPCKEGDFNFKLVQ